MISRLNNDVIGAQQAFTDLFSNVVGNVILVLIILVVMLILSWPITLVALVLVPISRSGETGGTATRDALSARYGAQRRDEHGDD